MIGYRITQTELEQRIRTQKADWLNRAKTRTATFRQQGRYEEDSSIWSEVKVVYIRLQGNAKCAYCERKLEAEERGKGEQDVDHFRPKSQVKSWKMPKSLADLGIKTSAVPNEKRGYFLLSYHPFNYAAACKPCNSALKRDYFPIADAYNLIGEDPKQLKKEKPYLIYPIGDWDTDPEQLIRFHGVSPQPVAVKGYRRHRALVTIEFFELDNVNRRKNLIRERAVIIIALFPQLEKLHPDKSSPTIFAYPSEH
jgi:5-methylcytosine-specific restriction endonuclease McrA